MNRVQRRGSENAAGAGGRRARRARVATLSAALSALLLGAGALMGCSVAEPLTETHTKAAWKERKPVDPDARLAVIAAFRAACLSSSLDLGGADRALAALGYEIDDISETDRRFVKGKTSALLRLQGPQGPSRCSVWDPRIDRFVAIGAVNEALEGVGLRYQPRDLAQLGDPEAHDVRGSALGSDYVSVISIVDGPEGAGLAILKSGKPPS